MTDADAGAPTGQYEPRRVLLAVHTGRRDIVELARTSAARLLDGGILVRVLEDEAEDLAIPGAEVVPFDADAARGAEIVMVFGGDGTFLRAAAELGWGAAGVVASPLPGPAGNVEFFLWLRRDAGPLRDEDVQRAVEEGPR